MGNWGEAFLFTGQSALQNGNHVSQKFIVFSADYRLACPLGFYTEFPNSLLSYLCEWRWDTVDEQEQHAQVAVHDIEGVISWIKDTVNGWAAQSGTHCGSWDTKNIFVLGASAGGNIVASAAADSANDSSIRPTAAAILSGFPETGQTSDPQGHWSCDSGSTMPGSCWIHVNNYLDCLNQQGQPPDHLLNGCKGGSGMYEEASPKNENWSYPTTPPFFLANAGGPITQHDDKDLSPLQLAVDFDAHLQGLNYDEGTNLNLCIVDGTGHATGFLDAWDPVDPTKQRRCEGDTGEVIESIVSFYVSFLES